MMKLNTALLMFICITAFALTPLTEVAQYVDKNKHLPNVPSQEEVNKDGIDVAKMDAKLLQKIEELTLYVIQLQKEVNELKSKK